MMNDKKMNNPLHSPHIQALRQLIKHGYDGDIEDILEMLEEESKTNPEGIMKMNEEWNAVLYPAKVIDHLMMSTFNYFPQVHKVSPEAQAVLFLMVRTQEQATGLVEVPKGIYARVLGWGSKRAGRISSCLQELINTNAISVVYEPSEGSTKPGIYKINAKFSKIGKGFKVTPVDTKTAGEYVQYPHTVTLLMNGRKQNLKCGSIHKIVDADADKNKKRASADLADPQSKPHTGSESQCNLNRHEEKNQDNIQDNVNLNMTNKSNLLTPEEDALFGQLSLNDFPGVMPGGV